ncbi:hypothetical protein EIN_037170 [Entamoeba invadens IP1]|uniref:EF-hand domain-containing protein n=1 Tax=Entamoeba invadens IP1 TaxID=370355 RepID=L7FL66_ENTIV|nr:hypothetical protein EIN_037170 [Entamoeba invadens IP1]ELP87657.1 hypothetical protein EIN_037170 [Entamoeba invadens IP1]|eukprot:XP_004254428.1 hypothetical protein EIN_037170 [Entamoeba invadens IP1]
MGLKGKAKELFESFDTDKNGYIDLEEFVVGMKELFNIRIVDSRIDTVCRYILRKIDGEGLFNARDFKLNKSEFQKLYNYIPEEPQFPFESLKELVSIFFHICDKNNDGFLNYFDFSDFIKKGTDLDTNMGNRMMAFTVVDQDENGQIDFDEFYDAIKHGKIKKVTLDDLTDELDKDH